MKPIGGAIDRALRKLGLDRDVARVSAIDAWPDAAREVFGAAADATHAVGLSDRAGQVHAQLWPYTRTRTRIVHMIAPPGWSLAPRPTRYNGCIRRPVHALQRMARMWLPPCGKWKAAVATAPRAGSGL